MCRDVTCDVAGEKMFADWLNTGITIEYLATEVLELGKAHLIKLKLVLFAFNFKSYLLLTYY